MPLNLKVSQYRHHILFHLERISYWWESWQFKW